MDAAAHKTTSLAEEEALEQLNQQLAQPQPCVATASIVLGVLQDRLFQQHSSCSAAVPLKTAVDEHLRRFQELFVTPAAAKLAKCKQPQDKVVALAKFLRGKLAKAPAHKQPLHTQYLPSALRESGKKQLDCLGIATAVLALCHQTAAQWPQLHAELAQAVMVVSDDHCWLALPATRAAVATAGGAGAGADAGAGAGADAGGQQQQQQQHDMIFVEVTDPAVLAPSQLTGSWLYAGGHGTLCSSSQLVMVLVAGLMPEELQEEGAAQQLRTVQLQLLDKLSVSHPQALFYSNFFRWGMLHEEEEVQQLAQAAESAAAAGGINISDLQALAMLPAQQLRSQQLYTTSLQRSTGWQWHPCSCATFGWLNRMQAALCGETDDLLCLVQGQQSACGAARQGTKCWLDMAVYLLQQALDALQGCTAVLRQYSGCAGKPNKAADTQLMEAVSDLWQNLADASKAVAYLRQLHTQEQASATPQVLQQQQQEVVVESESKPAGLAQQDEAAAEAELQQTPASVGVTLQQQDVQQQHQEGHQDCTSITGHAGADMPAAAAGAGHAVHLAAAVNKAAGSSLSQGTTAPKNISMADALHDSGALCRQLEFLDALLAFFGEESADVPAGIVADFITVARTYTSRARAVAVEDAAAREALHSSRTRGLLGSTAWSDLEPGLHQLLQMPGARSRKRQRKD